jgi:DNA-binding IclR family transcriptional regulator
MEANEISDVVKVKPIHSSRLGVSEIARQLGIGRASAYRCIAG